MAQLVIVFLAACAEQAKNDRVIAKEILDLRERMMHTAPIIKSRYAAELIGAMFVRPIFTLRDLEFANPPSQLTLRKLTDMLVHRGILELRHRGVRSRPAVYAFPQLLEICEK